jgi:hypothetical protein
MQTTFKLTATQTLMNGQPVTVKQNLSDLADYIKAKLQAGTCKGE